MTQILGILQRKIQIATELRDVVDTMKTMASVNIGIYEKVDRSLAEYYQIIEAGLQAVLHNYQPQLLAMQSLKVSAGVGAVIFGSDQGMVGQFNDYLARKVVEQLLPINREISVWCVGERIGLKLQDRLKLKSIYRVPDSANGITSLIGNILLNIVEQQKKGKIGELVIFYNKPNSGSNYETIVQRLLPLRTEWLLQLAGRRWPTKMVPQVITGDEAFWIFIREYLFIAMCWACAESLVSENIGRLASMQRAEKNIDDILNKLTSDYNEERQNSITEELFDVIFGYDELVRHTDEEHKDNQIIKSPTL